MKALTEKILVLGIDGMDPRLTKKFLDRKKLPNIEKLIQMGSCREDLSMLGALPTITPPMWTTLATGAYPSTHGITCFWNQHPTKIDTLVYANDSRNCKAERVWDVSAEANKKTLVFHWPGTSWPPTSDSANLAVIDGVQPTSVNFGVGLADMEQFFSASEAIQQEQQAIIEIDGSGAGCVVTDLGVEESMGSDTFDAVLNAKEISPILMDEYAGENENHGKPPFVNQVLIKPANGWLDAPVSAKEFTITTSKGLMRKPCLLLKNEQGIYDRLAIYNSKKSLEPIVVLMNGEYQSDIADEAFKSDEKVLVTRCFIAYGISPDGSSANLWVSGALQTDCSTLFHPKSLYQEIIKNVGNTRGVSLLLNCGVRPDIIEEVMLKSWKNYGDWQAGAINYLIEHHEYEVVFSHFHNVDNFGHVFWEQAKQFNGNLELEKKYERLMEMGYIDTDRYVGEFLHLLDSGWTIILTSDHGLLTKDEEVIQPALGDGFGINTKIMRELGYTVMKIDDNGNELPEIDWSKTTAVAPRGNHIYINLEGRQENGIVKHEDQYELERAIITDLYAYRYHGARIINLAIRNRDAALLGMSGPQCGDIIYFVEEGYNRAHGDALSTTIGYADTSVAPIFIAAGKGIKVNLKTDRVIRQVDVAPTIAVLAGLRMPKECEGAPIYQIIQYNL